MSSHPHAGQPSPVRAQMLVSFGTLCVILLTIAGMFFFSLRSIERLSQRQSRALLILAAVEDAGQDVEKMQAAVLRQLLASDVGEIRRLDQSVRDIEKNNAQDLTDARDFSDTAQERRLHERVMQTRNAYWEETQPVLAFGLINRDADAADAMILKQTPAYNACLNAINDLEDYVETDADGAAKTTARVISDIRIIGDVLAGLALAIVIGAGAAVVRAARRLTDDNTRLQVEVTERMRAEATVRESEEKFRQLSDNITEVFWITSPDLRQLLYVSAAYELIWGRSTTSAYAHPQEWSDAILPGERARVYAVFSRLAANEPSVTVEFPIVRPDGAVRWILSRGFQVKNSDGRVIRLVGIASDITERKQAAEVLRESERRFSDMLRHLELVAVMLDRDARITYCNDYLLRLTGWQREDVIGRNWFDLFLPTDRADEIRVVFSALLADQPAAWHHENEIVTRDGARRLIRWNNSVLRSSAGDVIGTASVGEDITERTRLEAQLLQSQKMETVGKLAGGVAHEFNSIMTAIIGQSELLLSDLPAGSPFSKNATEIRTAANRAATLTRQLLAYGRKQILRAEVLDLNAILAEMDSTLRHVMGQNTEVRIAPGAGLMSIKADAGQIEQVIMQMAMNAADAMPDGGKLMLETANVTFDDQSVGRYSELPPGNYVMLAITDTGRGMTEEIKARVFEPFFTTKNVGEGTGLGLSTCYGIIKQSGGHISVYSEPGRGTAFKIYLPQVDAAVKAPPPRLDTPDLPHGTETILLVEDDPALREMATALLRRLGYTVLAAANGIEALSLKRQPGIGHIDLLFTDVVMPHMSGKELADHVHALYPRTRILFTSAYTELAIVQQGGLDKGVALLQKPFTPSALAHKLRAVLDQPNGGV